MIDLTTIPVPFMTRLTLMSVPSVVTMYAAMNYYADFLRTQTKEFYDPNYIEEFDFIVGK